MNQVVFTTHKRHSTDRGLAGFVVDEKHHNQWKHLNGLGYEFIAELISVKTYVLYFHGYMPNLGGRHDIITDLCPNNPSIGQHVEKLIEKSFAWHENHGAKQE